MLCDVSGSMRRAIAGAPSVSKAEAAAEATNNAFMELVLAHRGGDGGVRNRLDVMLLQYGASIRSGLRGDVVGLADLAAQPIDFVNQAPIWVRPQIDTRQMPQRPGGTPMTGAFARARQLLRPVLDRPSQEGRRRLMLAFNITDGQPTDGNPESEIAALAADAAARGHDLIMTNIHVSESPLATPVLFPTEEQAARFDAYGQQLFRWSSPVPAELMPLVRELNPEADLGTGPRMMAVNANLEGLNSVLQAGSSLATTAAQPTP
jgi:hypothetical protein